MSAEARLKAMGVVLDAAPAVAAGYTPKFEPFTQCGSQLFLSGRISKKNGDLLIGRVGEAVTIEEARASAQGIALEHVGILKQATGDLERVMRILRVLVLVNGGPGFDRPHEVADGASDLFRNVFGDRGRHARSAMVAAGLPFNAAVEIEITAQVLTD